MKVIRLQTVTPTRREEKHFFYLQNYAGALSKKQLETFLLFCTGSVNMPLEIVVAFHNERGISRRPIVYTCSNLIELGNN